MSQYQNILVTGASGQLGRRLIRKLLALGYRVRGQYRSNEQAARWNPDGVEIVIGDVLEEGWYDRAVAGCDAVIHGAAWVTMRNVDMDLMRRVNVEGTIKVAEACRKSPTVKRLLQVSSVAAVGGSADGKPLDENTEFNLWRYRIPYFITKKMSEEEAFARNGAELEVVAVNPSIMISTPDRIVTAADLAKIPKRLPFYINIGLNLVNAEDVIDGIISALERGRPGERYLLTGDNIDQDKAFRLTEYYLGMKKPWLRIPYPFFVFTGLILDTVTRFRRIFKKDVRAPKLGYNFARLAKYRFFYDASKAKRELGFNPRPIERSIEEILPSMQNRIDSPYYRGETKKELQP